MTTPPTPGQPGHPAEEPGGWAPQDMAPGGPAAPTGPGAPADPGSPAGPGSPVDPGAPAGPGSPAGTGAPAGPGAPTQWAPPTWSGGQAPGWGAPTGHPTAGPAPDAPQWGPDRPGPAPGGPYPAAPGPSPAAPGWGAALPGSPSWAPAPQPGVIPLRPLGLGDLFDGTFRTVRANPAVMFGFSVAVMAVVSVISGLVEWAMLDRVTTSLGDPQSALAQSDSLTLMASEISQVLGGSLGTSAITWLATLVLTGMLALTVADAVLGCVTPLGSAWARIRPRFWPLLGNSVLTSLATALPALLLMGVSSLPLVVPVVRGDSPSGWAALPLVLGVLVGIVLILYVQVRLLFGPTSVVLEDLGPVQAMRRSLVLTRGSFWRVLGRLVLITVCTSAAVGVVGGAVGLLGGVIAFTTTSNVGVALTGMLTGIAAGFVVPVTAGFETLMYVDERMRREDLAPTLARAAREG